MACGGFLSGILTLVGVVVVFKIVRHLVWRHRGGCGGGGGGGCGWGRWRGPHGPHGGHDGDHYAGYDDGPHGDEGFWAHGDHPYRSGDARPQADEVSWSEVTDRSRRRRRRAWRRGAGLVAARVGATAEQRDVIESAADELSAAFDQHEGELAYTREELARALREPDFDATRMGELFARHDTAIDTVRKAAVGALASVHDALEPDQRERLAKIVERARR